MSTNGPRKLEPKEIFDKLVQRLKSKKYDVLRPAWTAPVLAIFEEMGRESGYFVEQDSHGRRDLIWWSFSEDDKRDIELALEYENGGSNDLVDEVRKKLIPVQSHFKCGVALDNSPAVTRKHHQEIEQLMDAYQVKDSVETTWFFMALYFDVGRFPEEELPNVIGYVGNSKDGHWKIEEKWRCENLSAK